VVGKTPGETMKDYFERFAGKAVDEFAKKKNPEQFLDMTEMFVVDQIMNDDFFEDYGFKELQAAEKIKLLEDIREVFADLKLVCALMPNPESRIGLTYDQVKSVKSVQLGVSSSSLPKYMRQLEFLVSQLKLRNAAERPKLTFAEKDLAIWFDPKYEFLLPYVDLQGKTFQISQDKVTDPKYLKLFALKLDVNYECTFAGTSQVLSGEQLELVSLAAIEGLVPKALDAKGFKFAKNDASDPDEFKQFADRTALLQFLRISSLSCLSLPAEDFAKNLSKLSGSFESDDIFNYLNDLMTDGALSLNVVRNVLAYTSSLGFNAPAGLEAKICSNTRLATEFVKYANLSVFMNQDYKLDYDPADKHFKLVGYGFGPVPKYEFRPPIMHTRMEYSYGADGSVRGMPVQEMIAPGFEYVSGYEIGYRELDEKIRIFDCRITEDTLTFIGRHVEFDTWSGKESQRKLTYSGHVYDEMLKVERMQLVANQHSDYKLQVRPQVDIYEKNSKGESVVKSDPTKATEGYKASFRFDEKVMSLDASAKASMHDTKTVKIKDPSTVEPGYGYIKIDGVQYILYSQLGDYLKTLNVDHPNSKAFLSSVLSFSNTATPQQKEDLAEVFGPWIKAKYPDEFAKIKFYSTFGYDHRDWPPIQKFLQSPERSFNQLPEGFTLNGNTLQISGTDRNQIETGIIDFFKLPASAAVNKVVFTEFGTLGLYFQSLISAMPERVTSVQVLKGEVIRAPLNLVLTNKPNLRIDFKSAKDFHFPRFKSLHEALKGAIAVRVGLPALDFAQLTKEMQSYLKEQYKADQSTFGMFGFSDDFVKAMQGEAESSDESDTVEEVKDLDDDVADEETPGESSEDSSRASENVPELEDTEEYDGEVEEDESGSEDEARSTSSDSGVERESSESKSEGSEAAKQVSKPKSDRTEESTPVEKASSDSAQKAEDSSPAEREQQQAAKPSAAAKPDKGEKSAPAAPAKSVAAPKPPAEAAKTSGVPKTPEPAKSVEPPKSAAHAQPSGRATPAEPVTPAAPAQTEPQRQVLEAAAPVVVPTKDDTKTDEKPEDEKSSQEAGTAGKSADKSADKAQDEVRVEAPQALQPQPKAVDPSTLDPAPESRTGSLLRPLRTRLETRYTGVTVNSSQLPAVVQGDTTDHPSYHPSMEDGSYEGLAYSYEFVLGERKSTAKVPAEFQSLLKTVPNLDKIYKAGFSLKKSGENFKVVSKDDQESSEVTAGLLRKLTDGIYFDLTAVDRTGAMGIHEFFTTLTGTKTIPDQDEEIYSIQKVDIKPSNTIYFGQLKSAYKRYSGYLYKIVDKKPSVQRTLIDKYARFFEYKDGNHTNIIDWFRDNYDLLVRLVDKDQLVQDATLKKLPLAYQYLVSILLTTKSEDRKQIPVPAGLGLNWEVDSDVPTDFVRSVELSLVSPMVSEDIDVSDARAKALQTGRYDTGEIKQHSLGNFVLSFEEEKRDGVRSILSIEDPESYFVSLSSAEQRVFMTKLQELYQQVLSTSEKESDLVNLPVFRLLFSSYRQVDVSSEFQTRLKFDQPHQAIAPLQKLALIQGGRLKSGMSRIQIPPSADVQLKIGNRRALSQISLLINETSYTIDLRGKTRDDIEGLESKLQTVDRPIESFVGKTSNNKYTLDTSAIKKLQVFGLNMSATKLVFDSKPSVEVLQVKYEKSANKSSVLAKIGGKFVYFETSGYLKPVDKVAEAQAAQQAQEQARLQAAKAKEAAEKPQTVMLQSQSFSIKPVALRSVYPDLPLDSFKVQDGASERDGRPFELDPTKTQELLRALSKFKLEKFKPFIKVLGTNILNVKAAFVMTDPMLVLPRLSFRDQKAYIELANEIIKQFGETVSLPIQKVRYLQSERGEFSVQILAAPHLSQVAKHPILQTLNDSTLFKSTSTTADFDGTAPVTVSYNAPSFSKVTISYSKDSGKDIVIFPTKTFNGRDFIKAAKELKALVEAFEIPKSPIIDSKDGRHRLLNADLVSDVQLAISTISQNVDATRIQFSKDAKITMHSAPVQSGDRWQYTVQVQDAGQVYLLMFKSTEENLRFDTAPQAQTVLPPALQFKLVEYSKSKPHKISIREKSGAELKIRSDRKSMNVYNANPEKFEFVRATGYFMIGQRGSEVWLMQIRQNGPFYQITDELLADLNRLADISHPRANYQFEDYKADEKAKTALLAKYPGVFKPGAKFTVVGDKIKVGGSSYEIGKVFTGKKVGRKHLILWERMYFAHEELFDKSQSVRIDPEVWKLCNENLNHPYLKSVKDVWWFSKELMTILTGNFTRLGSGVTLVDPNLSIVLNGKTHPLATIFNEPWKSVPKSLFEVIEENQDKFALISDYTNKALTPQKLKEIFAAAQVAPGSKFYIDPQYKSFVDESKAIFAAKEVVEFMRDYPFGEFLEVKDLTQFTFKDEQVMYGTPPKSVPAKDKLYNAEDKAKTVKQMRSGFTKIGDKLLVREVDKSRLPFDKSKIVTFTSKPGEFEKAVLRSVAPSLSTNVLDLFAKLTTISDKEPLSILDYSVELIHKAQVSIDTMLSEYSVLNKHFAGLLKPFQLNSLNVVKQAGQASAKARPTAVDLTRPDKAYFSRLTQKQVEGGGSRIYGHYLTGTKQFGSSAFQNKAPINLRSRKAEVAGVKYMITNGLLLIADYQAETVSESIKSRTDLLNQFGLVFKGLFFPILKRAQDSRASDTYGHPIAVGSMTKVEVKSGKLYIDGVNTRAKSKSRVVDKSLDIPVTGIDSYFDFAGDVAYDSAKRTFTVQAGGSIKAKPGRHTYFGPKFKAEEIKTVQLTDQKDEFVINGKSKLKIKVK